MNFIIKILSIIGALTFIFAGTTGLVEPFGYFVQHTVLLRVFEVLLGSTLIYNVLKLK